MAISAVIPGLRRRRWHLELPGGLVPKRTLATRRYRERKRALGLCMYGGCYEPVLSTVLCPKHKGLNKRYPSRSKARSGACRIPSCGDSARPKGWYCLGHSIWQVRRAALGLCLSCQLDAVPGRTMCPRHAALNRKRVAAYKLRRLLALEESAVVLELEQGIWIHGRAY